jgi:hypothetical protein
MKIRPGTVEVLRERPDAAGEIWPPLSPTTVRELRAIMFGERPPAAASD